ncbi:MAG: aldo/keto reductase, partial [Rhodoferax sp.]|nr:aldo/keto reductase [Rhodoferax sp.]
EATPMQVALAWLLQRSPNVLLIPGTSSRAHLGENLAAASLELPTDALARLNRIGSEVAGLYQDHGARGGPVGQD